MPVELLPMHIDYGAFTAAVVDEFERLMRS
jgi:hypothetical protein